MSKYELIFLPPKSNVAPSPRSGHRCVTDGVFLYLFGGFSPIFSEKLFREIWCFNLSLQTWHKLETSGPSPVCVASSNLILSRGKLIVFGGSGYPFGSHNSNQTFIFNLRARKWEEIQNCFGNGLPVKGYGQSAVVSPDNCMYVFGGTKGLEYMNDLNKMDLDSYSWEHVRSHESPSARYRHEGVSIDGGFLILGGYDEDGACPLDEVFIFRYDDRVWRKVSCNGDKEHGFPKPRRAHSCVKYNKDVYVCGGYDGSMNEAGEPGAYDDVWKLDLTTFSWYKINQVLPLATFFHSAAVTRDGCMYIFGGVQQTGKYDRKRTNDMFKMWLVIPPLLELCWEKFCTTVQVSTKLGKRSLAALGIPRHLIARC